MKHSFIAPRRKRVISGELRLVLFFFAVTIAMVVGTYLFLEYKTYDFANERKEVARKSIELQHSIEAMDEEIKIIETEAKIVEQISTDNTVMKESIKNLFDLVPEDITLTRAELEEKSLILYGITPNKDTYEYMLHAPLHSIFNRTYTSYYPAENGWYRFVSSNYLDEETVEEVEE
jgi:cell division protein FtsL